MAHPTRGNGGEGGRKGHDMGPAHTSSAVGNPAERSRLLAAEMVTTAPCGLD